MKRQLPSWSVPLALLALCILAYGLLITRLGFYWDDWSPVLVERLYGANGFWKFYAFDRPSSAWTYWLIAPILDGRPLNWQLFTLSLRWLTATALWWTLSGLWPQARRQAAWAALLFAVYPVFTQQSISVTYHQLWMEYVFFFVSLGAMLQALRRPRYFWPFTLLSLTAFGLNLSISEYFLGVEMLRPLMIWFVLPAVLPWRKRLLATLRHWLAYLLPLTGYVVWRLAFADLTGGDPNKPYLLYQLTQTPLSALRELLQIALQDLVRILFSSWYSALQPELVDLGRAFAIFTWGVVLVTAALAAFYAYRLDDTSPNEAERPTWLRQAALLGALAVLLGPAPAWITGRYISDNLFTDRFGATAMFGASLLIVAAISWLSQRRLQQTLLLGLLLGLAAGAHLRTANEYQWWWTQQTRFFWQLAWRAPYIQPNTALLTKDDVFPKQGRFATSVALNLLYPQPQAPQYLAYWVFSDLKPTFSSGEWRKGKKLDDDFRIFKFLGYSRDSLVLYYHPEDGACLWVMGPENRALPQQIPAGIQRGLPLSNLERIVTQAPQPGYPPAEIFGPEPKDSWCYYFEKADLARQLKDWPQVLALGEEARSQGYSPANSASNLPYEWLPFLEAYVQTGAWPQAEQLTFEISRAKRASTDDTLLCQYWYAVDKDAATAGGEERSATLKNIYTTLNCP